MKVALFAASTVNGIIAKSNDNEDFLPNENWKTFKDLAEEFGCFVIGRRTYEVAQKSKDYNFDKIQAKKIVVSKSKLKINHKDYFLARSPKEAIKKAKELGYKKLLIVGGGKNNSSFMKNKFVDEIILNINPHILGRGIRLFAEEEFESKLKLTGIKRLKDIIQLHYLVKK